MNSRQPYIGITGVRTPEDMAVCASTMQESGLSETSSHIGMTGLAYHQPSIDKGKLLGPIYFDSPDALLPTLAASRERTLNMMHYTPPASGFTADAVEYAVIPTYAHGCQALQVNGQYTPQDIRELRTRYPHLKTVYVVDRALMQEDGEIITTEAARFRQLAEYIILDPSGGQGRDMNVTRSADIAKRIEDAQLDMTVIFAGGNSSSNIEERCTKLRDALGHNNFGIDAEGKLQTAERKLDHNEATTYVQQAAKALL